MLGSIRKFSTSIYAKILLGIVIIPFVFWGMGSAFVGGDKNIIVTIDNEKYSIKEFGDYVQKFAAKNNKVSASQIEEILYLYIGDKLIENEVENLNISLSDDSLSKLIKHQKEFQRDGKFSRVEYEKFLLTSNITAVEFEQNLSKYEKKKQLLSFISGGVRVPEFFTTTEFNKINQKRNIEIINLNNLFDKKINISENDIKSYFDQNSENFKKIYKSVKIINLNPNDLVGTDEFNDLFFKKIDEIDNKIIQGRNLEYIAKDFNLKKIKSLKIDKDGNNLDSTNKESIPDALIDIIFSNEEPVMLAEIKDKYFLFEIVSTENILNDINKIDVKNEVVANLMKRSKQKMVSEIASKINSNSYQKSDFDELSKKENIKIDKVSLNSQNDKKFKKELMEQIYSFIEKKVVIVHDVNFTENYLIYIDNIENVKIEKDSEEYETYQNLAQYKTTQDLYNAYDQYIKKKYKININKQAVDTVKSYFTN